jgi:uncharacterized protein YbcI
MLLEHAVRWAASLRFSSSRAPFRGAEREVPMTVTDYGLAIANAITKLHRQYYGRGAATARTVLGRDHIVVFLEDVYTTLERTLIDDGKFETVRTTRKAFQLTLEDAFTAAVEEITGRKVIAFMSEVHESPDIACELFVLAPE